MQDSIIFSSIFDNTKCYKIGSVYPKLNDWMRHIAMNYVDAVLIQMYINWKLTFSGKSSFQTVVYAALKVV